MLRAASSFSCGTDFQVGLPGRDGAMQILLAEANTAARITDPAGVLAVLMAVLAAILYLQT